jgi:hypothetical protein
MKQLLEKRPDINPIHVLMNLLAISVFPFIMKPIFHASGIMNEKVFQTRMEERKALIPKWINAMLKAK